MANTRHTYHLHSKEIEEIIRNNGLPEEISTETQLWDLIIKKSNLQFSQTPVSAHL